MEIVTVFASDDLEEIAIIRNILDNNGINYLVKNEYTQNIFGGVKPFSGHDPIAGSIQIQIKEDDFDKCIQLIDENTIDDNVDNCNIETIEEVENDITDEPFIAKAKEQRKIYFAQVLSVFSILLLPYIVNLFILYSIKNRNRKLAIMLFIVSTLMAVLGLSFIVLK